MISVNGTHECDQPRDLETEIHRSQTDLLNKHRNTEAYHFHRVLTNMFDPAVRPTLIRISDCLK